MSLPPWDESLSVNNTAIDSQHQQLIALVQNLPEREDESFDQAIQFLLRYTFEHFTDEERLMEAEEYPQLAQHINLHRSLESLFDHHFHRYLDGEMAHPEFQAFLHNWVTSHIRQADRAFADFLHQDA